jgi:hypothetical protein
VGLFGSMVKAGVAKKVFDEARKPHNQQKAKEMFSRLTSKGGKGGGSYGGGAGRGH